MNWLYDVNATIKQEDIENIFIKDYFKENNYGQNEN